MDSIYHTLRKSNPASARILVRKVLEKNNGNVSKTARILGISRATVRRARDGELNDLSRRPKNIRKKIDCSLEKLIVDVKATINSPPKGLINSPRHPLIFVSLSSYQIPPHSSTPFPNLATNI
ncbi:helix-turn-helix Fis-type [Hippea maritima DSM 10411]|uniref:Helix-turn-helix Fis-type n=1 Tax=Hippea maritima (strain ATCC 700847 / DSM 10411 / MH2) TaxID=760142 RepID=F2LU80_HIPMA|nr:helix-turn-helix domain-containing protein [Hippea maritima]AEA34543.1 helix-turn-helix Fis-type [Hippea maritima DSM 10411]